MPKRSRKSDEYDSPWKQALHILLRSFLEFFYSDIAAGIDWSRGSESLDKELQRIARRAKIGKRIADKLFKVWLTNGEEHWLLIHIEIQREFDKDFEERMFEYNIAAYQMYNRHAVTLADCKARETENDPANRRLWKMRIVRKLYERNWAEEQIPASNVSVTSEDWKKHAAACLKVSAWCCMSSSDRPVSNCCQRCAN